MTNRTKILIAEDEAIIRLDLKESLEAEGYEVVGETGRGDEVIGLVRSLEPDLVILDIKMPGMTGIQAAEIITEEGLGIIRCSLNGSSPGIFQFWITTSFLALIDRGR